MPKTEIDYSNTIFYKIQCKNPDVKDVYIGHTTNFVQRKHAHKRSCTNATADSYNCKVYNVIREFGGWDNWKMEIIAFRECADHYAARKIEQQYFEEYNATLNSIEPLPKPKVILPKETQIKPEKQILYCETCCVYFPTTSARDIHNKTNKHIKMLVKNNNPIMDTKKSSGVVPKYKCENCNYVCSRKYDYEKHIITSKHILESSGNNPNPQALKYCCKYCNNVYQDRSGLYKHNQKCKPPSPPEENIQTTFEHIEPNSAELLVLVKELIIQIAAKDKQQDELIVQIAAKDKQQDELILQFAAKDKQQDELIKQNIELQNIMRELIPHIGNNKPHQREKL